MLETFAHTTESSRWTEETLSVPSKPGDMRLWFIGQEGSESRATDLKLNEFGEIVNWPQNSFGDPLGDTARIAKAGMRRRRDVALCPTPVGCCRHKHPDRCERPWPEGCDVLNRGGHRLARPGRVCQWHHTRARGAIPVRRPVACVVSFPSFEQEIKNVSLSKIS